MDLSLKRKKDFIDAVLARLDHLPIADVQVTHEGGRMTLAGYARDGASRAAAEKTAAEMCGATAVVNRIEIEPVLRRQHYSDANSDFRDKMRQRILSSLQLCA